MVCVLCESVIWIRKLIERSRKSNMVNIQILALLAIVFCFTLQSQASPLALSEDETDREETDREFEDAFEAAINEEVAREFQSQNAYNARDFDDEEEEARDFDDDEEETRTLQSSYLNALQEELARNFEDEEEMNVRENDQSEDERQISADFDITPPKVYDDAQQFEDERQISADFDITPPKVSEDDQQSEFERQVSADVITPGKESEVPDVKPRATNSLRLSKLIIRPMLTKRCQSKTNFSLAHCAKYLSCGTSMFRGAIRTCESGQLFDAVLKKCNDADKVDCKIRT